MSSEHDASYGNPLPPEASQGGTMNHNPNFKKNEGDEPEVEATVFGVSNDGRTPVVLPGKYPAPARTVRTTGDKTVTLKKGTLTRTDH